MKYNFQNGKRDKNPQNLNLFFYKKYLVSTGYICILRVMENNILNKKHMIYRILLFPIYLMIGCLSIFTCGTYEMFNMFNIFINKR